MDDPRGFSLSHQRVVLDIDLSGIITATAYLTINPTSPALRTLYLHASPLLQISSVTLSSPTASEPLLPTPASYALTQPFQPLPTREPPVDLKSHTEIKRKTWAAMGERDNGELAISVSGGWVRLIRNDDETMRFAPIEVQIDYRLAVGKDVVEGIVFHHGDEEVPHMFLSPTAYDSARIWTPCVDSLWERCTWELEFIVPSEVQGLPTMVVSSGELVEQVVHPNTPSKTIFYYLQPTPTTVQHITFAAGPFEMITICETPKPILAFCLPGDRELLVNSTTTLPRAMSFYSTEFGSYPFSEYKLVFVSSPRVDCSTAATLSILSSDLLYPPEIIDQAITTRQVLALALIQQWVGINIIQRTLADTWIIHGLALYLQSLFLKHLFGNNEYRYRLKRDIDRCVQLDQGDQWPLCVPGSSHIYDISFLNLKSPIVLHILDRHIAKAGTSLGLSRVIPRIFLAALSDELTGNTLSTQFFFRTCRKVSGIDLQTFQDQWVLSSGCPRFRLSTNFIRKKFTVELDIQQTTPSSPRSTVPFFEGSLTVRIHEADGAPFEHVVDIKGKNKVANLPFNTKYKRTRRSGRIAARFHRFQADLEAAADDDPEEPRDVGVFSYPPWDDEEERSDWRVADWSEEQAEQMLGEGGGYEWIRIDPDSEWLASFEFQEKPWYWISQLQGDRDVSAQLEAIRNMSVFPFPVMASELARTVLVKNFYYRVRMEAVKALVNYSTRESDYLGLFLLRKLFQVYFCVPQRGDPATVDMEIKPNDFSDHPDYFIKKVILEALAGLRDPITRSSWIENRRLLLKILRDNDNTLNPYSDSGYIAALVSSIGNAFSASGRPDADMSLAREAIDAVDRVITLDRLVPSYHSVVTDAGLKTMIKLIYAGYRTNDPRVFLSYTREGNFEPVRMTAFDCLLLCRPPGRSLPLAKYLKDVIENDGSLTVRRHVAQALANSILMSLGIGELLLTSAIPGIVDVTNDTNETQLERSENLNTAIVKAVRKEFIKKEELRPILQSLLLDNFSRDDDQVRFAMIKVAEIVTSASSEPLPGKIITLSTPMVETPAAMTPRIRLSLGGIMKSEVESEYPFPHVDASALGAPIKLVIGPNTNKKKKAGPSAENKGLSKSERVAISMTLKRLIAFKESYLFRQPVDPVRDDAPNYLTIIKRPMDLSTATAKLDSGNYAHRQQFVDDIRQIIANCFIYNAVGSPVYKVGQKFESFFNELWSKAETTLNGSAGQSQPTSRAPPVEAKMESPSMSMPVKLKLKPSKSESLLTERVAPMAPPPLPPTRRPSAQTPPVISSPDGSRKRKDVGLDDMLGAEVDIIESKKKSAVQDPIEPIPKRPKISITSRISPEKQVEARLPFPTTPVVQMNRAKPSMSTPPITSAPGYIPHPVTPAAIPSKPADLPRTVGNPLAFKPKRSKALINTLKNHPSAALFLHPVDPIKDGCPTYLDEIKEPMDLGTIGKRMESKQYRTMGELAYDIELIFKNCRQFNTPGDTITALADAVEATYWKEWPKTVSPKMSAPERKDMGGLLNKTLKDDVSLYFREAVDPIRLGIPSYFEIIPKDQARDLSLIKRKLEGNVYTTFQQVDEDVELMLHNARVFNQVGEVVDAANRLGQYWQNQRARVE